MTQPAFYEIVFSGNLPLPPALREKLSNAVRRQLADVSVHLRQVTVELREAPDGELGCAVTAVTLAGLRLTEQDAGTFLGTMADRASARLRRALLEVTPNAPHGTRSAR